MKKQTFQLLTILAVTASVGCSSGSSSSSSSSSTSNSTTTTAVTAAGNGGTEGMTVTQNGNVTTLSGNDMNGNLENLTITQNGNTITIAGIGLGGNEENVTLTVTTSGNITTVSGYGTNGIENLTITQNGDNASIYGFGPGGNVISMNVATYNPLQGVGWLVAIAQTDGEASDSFHASGDFVDQSVANANLSNPAAILAGEESVASNGDRANLSNSVGGDTKDVNLQRAQLEGVDLDSRATDVANEFNMNLDNAKQFVALADRVQAMTAAGKMTEADRDAVTASALSIAQINKDDVNNAITSMVRDGNQDAINQLMDKAATNLGMPSSASLRDRLLPALGIHF